MRSQYVMGCLLAIVGSYSTFAFLRGCAKAHEENREVVLLGEISETDIGPRRDKLIDELERTPEYMRSFVDRWYFIHFEYENFPKCWSDNGFDPTRSHLPRDILIWGAAKYGESDINNGGFHQFFSNHTGILAPELVEWLNQVGLEDAAGIVQEAMAVFGENYPRSQDVRNDFLDNIKGQSREEWDPFYELDEPFYDAASYEKFQAVEESWLRETCGIKHLRDLPAKG